MSEVPVRYVKTVPVGAIEVIRQSLELLAVLRTHAGLLPVPVLQQMGVFAAAVQEHVEVVP